LAGQVNDYIMWYVYGLKRRDASLYIGSTDDIYRRLREHRDGRSKSTASLLPVSLEFSIAVKTEKIARNLEKYLKTGSGRAVLKKRILTDEATAAEA